MVTQRTKTKMLDRCNSADGPFDPKSHLPRISQVEMRLVNIVSHDFITRMILYIWRQSWYPLVLKHSQLFLAPWIRVWPVLHHFDNNLLNEARELFTKTGNLPYSKTLNTAQRTQWYELLVMRNAECHLIHDHRHKHQHSVARTKSSGENRRRPWEHTENQRQIERHARRWISAQRPRRTRRQ